MSDSVECGEHGTRDAACVCRHLLRGRHAGFHQGFDPDEPTRLFPDGWCDACEEVRGDQGAWNERALTFAGLRTLCSACYMRVRSLNWPRDSDAGTARLVDQAFEWLEERQERLRTEYRLSDHARYDWNQETGQLVFSNDGVPAVVAEIQFAGSVSKRSNTWLWSWANESFLPAVTSEVHEVREHGEMHRLLKLACPFWEGTEEDGWQMAAVTAFLLKAQGVYRSPDDLGFTFMVMTGIGWAQ